MSANHSNVPAVAYYRTSTDKLADSIPRQESQVVSYARRKGYEPVAEYHDAGSAGDAPQHGEPV